MKKALFFFFALSSKINFGQNQFLVFGSGANDSFNSVIRTADHGWCMAGTTGGEIGSQTDVYVVKTDNDFNCLWSLNVGAEGVEIETDAVQRSNGEIIICGYSVDNPSLGYENYLVRIAPNGNVLSQLRWGDAIWNRLHHMVVDDANQVYLIEESYEANGDHLFQLKAIDDLGNTLWSMPLSTSILPAELKIYQNKLYVAFQEDVANGSQLVVHQFELDGTLSGIFISPETSAIVHGLVVNVFGVTVVGEHPNGVFRNPYTCVFNFDTSVSLEQAFNYDYNAWYTRAGVTQEGYTLVGETTSLGLGMVDWIVHRTNASCQFINGGTVGSAKSDLVGDVQVVNDSVVVVGSSNGFALNQQNQAVLYFNPSSNLNNQDITPFATNCFYVGIDPINRDSEMQWLIQEEMANWTCSGDSPSLVRLFDLSGRCLGNWQNRNQIPLPSQQGMYFLQYKVAEKNYTQKILLHP
ncbi:MAG: T9SS type A sorting domain-containing protein [Bacteroidetes bacterium]|nr:T9SS type A sorting domain-containing protein [Bacteroidota bacterium]